MANKTATISISIAYTNEDDDEDTKESSVTAPYNTSARGEIDVPDLTAAATAYTIPFGSIASATCVWLKNETGQELILKINGSANLQRIEDNGELLLSNEASPGSAPLSAVSLTTTAEQAGAGSIGFLVLGDPT